MQFFCLEHALEEVNLIEYHDSNKELGKFIAKIPSKFVRANKCAGRVKYKKQVRACFGWGVYGVMLISKEDAFISDQLTSIGSPIHKTHEIHNAEILGVATDKVLLTINKRYKKTDKLSRLDID